MLISCQSFSSCFVESAVGIAFETSPTGKGGYG
jgi:hypothetical protein